MYVNNVKKQILTFKNIFQSVLASIIVVALKGMFTQAKALKKFWILSKLDATVWIITFLTVVIVNVDIGLFVGLAISVLSLLFLGMKPYVCLMGVIPQTDIYVDMSRYKKVFM